MRLFRLLLALAFDLEKSSDMMGARLTKQKTRPPGVHPNASTLPCAQKVTAAYSEGVQMLARDTCSER